MSCHPRSTSDPQEESVSPRDRLLGQLADQFLAAIERGETPSIAAIAARYPDDADIILQTLPALASMREPQAVPAAVMMPGLTTDGGLPETGLGQLGDFQLIRELGRGGMGIVYEAEQVSLRRRVALKVLPFAALLDARRLARFQQEARAAALLKHENIVAVHSVGCDAGVHYYAMELVTGRSFGHVLQELQLTRAEAQPPSRKDTERPTADGADELRAANRPGLPVRPAADTRPIAAISTQYRDRRRSYFLSIARLFAQIARAVHYAHEHGIIHRDLKPSNLLLDQQGRPWITDFGLAQVQGDHALTMSGDLLGTLRYMSPEQARGKQVLDERTDIYSLGVTLYELLTLQGPYAQSEQRHLLKQIEEDAPVPLRRRDPRIPKDLETIVLKAMAKRPADRYDSAAEMANDLERYIEWKPVRARRTGAVHQVTRWVQRYRLASLMAGILALVVCSLAVIGPLLSIRYAQLASAESQARAESLAVRHELNRILTDSLYRTIASLENSPGTGQLQRDVLRDTEQLCYRLIILGQDDPSIRFQIGRALSLIGFSENLVGDPEKARRLTQKAIEIQQALVKEDPDNVDYAFELGMAWYVLGNSLVDIDTLQAIDFCQQGVDALGRAESLSPDNEAVEIEYHYACEFLGRMKHQAGAYREAEQLLLRVRREGRRRVEANSASFESVRNWSYGRSFLSDIYARTGRTSQAEQELREVLELCSRWMPQIEENTRCRLGYADYLGLLGQTLHARCQEEEAENYLRQAITNLEEVDRSFPGTTWCRGSLAANWGTISEVLLAEHRPDEAIAAARVAADTLSADGDLTEHAAWFRYRLATVLWWTGHREEAESVFRAAIGDLQRCGKDSSRQSLIRRAVALSTCPCEELRDPAQGLAYAHRVSSPEDGQSLRLLGITLGRAGEWSTAQEVFQQGLAPLNGGDSGDFYYLAISHAMLGNRELARRWYDRAEAARHQPQVLRDLEYPIYLPHLREEAREILAR